MIGVAVAIVAVAIAFSIMAWVTSDPIGLRCRARVPRGGPCMSPNGCGDWGPPPRRLRRDPDERSILAALDKPLVPPVERFEIPLRRLA